MTNHYRTGRDFEWRTRSVLRDAGYEVIRAAGSKTKADLLAIKAGELLFIQCKRTALPSPAERRALLHMTEHLVGAHALIARRGPRGTPVVFERLTGPAANQREPFQIDLPTEET